MRHSRRNPKLNRTSAHRKAMLSNLAASIVEHETVVTTEAKAKAVIPVLERLITLSKQGSLQSRRLVESKLPTVRVANKVNDILAKRYEAVSSGFVTKVRMPKRMGDDSRMIRVTLLPGKEQKATEKKKSAKRASANKAETKTEKK